MNKVPYPELRAEMARRGETQRFLAKLLSIGHATISRKIQGQADWRFSEINTLCSHYNKPFDVLFRSE